ncbi:hypothetical protein AB1J99_30920 [Bacillus bombysepticus]|uniref:Uncharacterized protein n=1 Tax=Bacillus thuringiensis serovar mexicanensis TaxID=180868 RepID=A0A242WAT6_BACTU|nr:MULTISPECIES: hypothetical protein [Bacillus cereus group]MEB9673217.1 hypothetical protein [Bacillus anthracis]OTW50802.1 hypothetical protein BK699_09640 [Bacillus thuringiensis serovar mexicanensis]OTX09487.1 hypothetical protein BK705_04685 [Bacillus thuringiensis serovar monterrey]PFJ30712.1 hypothetical protein COI92_06910 [Bacillus anthracis]
MKRIVLSMGHEDLHGIFRKFLKSKFIVCMNDVFSSNYLFDVIEEDHPDIIIFHDKHLEIPYDPEQENQVEENLYKEIKFLEIIEYIRQTYNDSIRVVFICERPQGDPFLSELVNNNVLDIFYTNQFALDALVEQLVNPPQYNNVAHLKVDNSNTKYKSHLFGKNSLFEFKEDEQLTELVETEDVLKTAIEEETEETNSLVHNDKRKPGLFSKLFGKDKNDSEDNTVVINNSDEDPKVEENNCEGNLSETELVKEEEPLNQDIPQNTNIPPKDLIEEVEELVSDNNKEDLKKDIDIGEEVSQEDVNKGTDSSALRADKYKGKGRNVFFNIFKKDTSVDTKDYGYSDHRNVGSVKQNLIAVVSLTPGAGSTFFLHNFTRFLSLEHGISSSVLDTPSEFPIWYHLLNAEQEHHEYWEEVHQAIKTRPETFGYIPRWSIDNINFFPCQSSTLDFNSKDSNKNRDFTPLEAKELIFHSRSSGISFVDLSHNWSNKLATETLALCNQIWLIMEPNYQSLAAAGHQHKILKGFEQLAKDEKIITIGNKWNKKFDDVLSPEIALPYFESQAEASLKGKPLYTLQSKLMKREFEKLLYKLS